MTFDTPPLLIAIFREQDDDKDSPGTRRRKSILERFKSSISPIFSLADKLDSSALRTVRRRVGIFREEVQAKFSDLASRARRSLPFEWGPGWLRPVEDMIRTSATKTATSHAEDLAGFLPESFSIGRRFVDDPLLAMSSELSAAELAALSDLPSARAISSLPPDFVRRLGKQQSEVVMREVIKSVSLGEGASQLADRLSSPLGKSPWKDARYRAERIARTEIQRVQAIAFEERLRQVNSEFPGLRIRKIYVTVRIGQWPCPICEPYDGRIYLPDGTPVNPGSEVDRSGIPGGSITSSETAPSVPQHANCRCSYVPILPDAGRPKSGESTDFVGGVETSGQRSQSAVEDSPDGDGS